MGAVNRVVQELSSEQDKYRFWSKVDLRANPYICWGWQRGKNVDGYGTFTINHISERAPRIAYLDYYKVNPYKLCVLHTCDNPSCVNPHHLFLGTVKDNSEDCVKKNRVYRPVGEKSNSCKLKNEQIIEIFEKYNSGEYNKTQIGSVYGISHANVSFILGGKRWSHLAIKNTRGMRTKLSKEDVLQIRDMAAQGVRFKEIGDKYKIREDSVSKIVTRTNWKNI